MVIFHSYVSHYQRGNILVDTLVQCWIWAAADIGYPLDEGDHLLKICLASLMGSLSSSKVIQIDIDRWNIQHLWMHSYVCSW